jgi:hypothetical protein
MRSCFARTAWMIDAEYGRNEALVWEARSGKKRMYAYRKEKKLRHLVSASG